MDRRRFIQNAAVAAAAALPLSASLAAVRSDLRITRVRVFNPANTTNLAGPLGLSEIVVAIDTNAGITGYGQGGTPDLLRYAASLLIDQDPLRIEYLWQRMYRSSIYPAGRERLHAVGALDCALWDIKGKLLDVPVYQLLGGRARDYIECYKSYGPIRPEVARAEARKTMDEGYKAIRVFSIAGAGSSFDTRRGIDALVSLCTDLREGAGPSGEFIFDAHTRFDYADALHLCERLAPLSPLFVEDPLRQMDDYTLFERLRERTSVPLAAGEQFGELRDGNLPLVEQGLIDYLRSSIPNVGGITGYRKLAALCEAHSVAMVPHFTGPIATAAVVHALLSVPTPVINEAYKTQLPAYLKAGIDFRNGRMYPVDRPGLGVTVDEQRLNLIAQYTQPRPLELYQGESFQRPDGSHLYL